MWLTIEAFDSAGIVDNFNLGRADLQIGYSSAIWYLLSIYCRHIFLRLIEMMAMSMSMAMVMVMVMVRAMAMAMAMTMAMAMAIATVLVIVIIVPEVLRQVG